MDWETVVVIAVFGGLAFMEYRKWQKKHGADRRGEALFKSMFPELQPWLHPKNLVSYVRARSMREVPADGESWPNPPGFPGHVARIVIAAGRERVALVDPASGATQVEFQYEDNAEGAVMRVGKGKLTVVVTDMNALRVRYWHPEREFKWKSGRWTFDTRMAESSIDSGSSGSSFGDSSSSSSRTSTTTAVAAGAAAAGGAAGAGAFDGGGASSSWDGASESSDSGGGGESDGGAASATAY